MAMTAGSLLSGAAVRYQLTPLLGGTFLGALVWFETKGISLKCCCHTSQASLWMLVVDGDCSSYSTNRKRCCYFCVCLPWQMHFGVKSKFSRLYFEPLFIYRSTWVRPSHIVWTLACPIGHYRLLSYVTILFWETTEKKNVYLTYKSLSV